MISTNIFKIDYSEISNAIQSFTHADPCGNNPNFIIMSLDTLKRIQRDNLYLINPSKTLDFSHMIMGIPIAINDTLELGEIRVL